MIPPIIELLMKAVVWLGVAFLGAATIFALVIGLTSIWAQASFRRRKKAEQRHPNPAYKTATHVAVFVGPGFPSIWEQLAQDRRTP
jgi:heme/copper-type cytochrome/quinol oxidase subunit 2